MIVTIELPIRKVYKTPIGEYVVRERQANGRWKVITRGYDYQTSAFAALGRITARADEEE